MSEAVQNSCKSLTRRKRWKRIVSETSLTQMSNLLQFSSVAVYLLQALGGNCRTTLLVAASPFSPQAVPDSDIVQFGSSFRLLLSSLRT